MSNPSTVGEEPTFTSCNPFKDIDPFCVHPQKKFTYAQKFSAQAKREINKDNANAL